MISSADLGGLMAMMPAFATDDAADIHATNTVSVERLEAGLNRMIGDGANVIATTGSFGEFHTLLPEGNYSTRSDQAFPGDCGLNGLEG